MGTTYRCLIVDDETPAHKALISHISKFDDLEHSGSAYSGAEALKMLNENKYDIIFLDINMPVLNGVEVMELQPKRPLTIVTTAYSDFALSAYTNDAIDYLLKPISLEKFSKAIEKAKAYYIGYALEKQNATEEKFISYRSDGEVVKIRVNDIIYVESMGNYMKLFCHKLKSPHIVYGSLLGIAQDIASPDFVQVHRSFIVNKACISIIEQENITLTNAIKLPVGRKYKILLSNLK
ncbi:LytTR family transcriptional regulator [Flavobacterium rivuli WB 3.3-2 = DSM 21788]|uniref:LytTR family transcriptional regulator n=1 Tax=Flavobacterium rivuli WB 3.3-2 = DSM 21788 TaxID=1121895 RepID=A0A0A2M0Q2_9FLAO|nr:LytTR family DNA-binding domain-containing protein [Flavobacterium rivuli]KGO86192.1 LytTR family transcriptional regulator [Flavobacterium rivuli WB 3.3-2 = DSM 21788]